MYDWEEAARRESRRNAKLERGIWGRVEPSGGGEAVVCCTGEEEEQDKGGRVEGE